jgi:uncharacterized protein (TIGR02246 family)
MTLDSEKVSADVIAETDRHVMTAVAEASRGWKRAFNAGNALATADFYEDNAVMVASPYGTFIGKEQILEFWAGLIEQDYKDVVYDKTIARVLNSQSVCLSAGWKMNKANGTIQNETWVLQPNGKALLREDHFEVFV